MSQKLPVNGFKLVEDLSQFSKSFIKNYDENSDKGYFLEVDVEYPKNYLMIISIIYSYLKENKLKNVISLFATYSIKKTVLITLES